ncbi:MAG: Fe(3+) ABC transporter substrate-binding protein [Paracoccaceae bacterium]
MPAQPASAPILAAALAAALAASLALPAAADEVNVYSHRQPELIQPLFDAFTARTGIAVNVAFIDKGMAERLQSEGDRSPADLILTVDIARLSQVVEAGVTQAVDDPALAASIPAGFRDPANHWFGLTTRARVVYASRERVKDGEVTTYDDLADPKWKGRICSRPGTHDYNLALLAGMIAHRGEDAARAWAAGVKANLAMKPGGNDRAQVKSIWAGECDISLGNTYYMGQMQADPAEKPYADAVRIVYPAFEGGGTHVNISGMAMTKAAPNREAALKLMEFLASDEAQKLYAGTNHEFPVKPGVPRSALVESWGAFTPDSVSLSELARLRPAALRIMEEVNFDG